MKDLYSYLTQQPIIDGHQHVFSHRGVQNMLIDGTCCRVGMIDIEFDCLDQYKDIPGLFKKYMPECKNVKYWLASGLTIEDIKTVYDEHDNIVGFGELKLYDWFKDKPVNFKKISFAREVCKFSEQCGNLPVYIHYEFNKDKEVRHFEKLIQEFPDVPIVICHCGMNEKNCEYAWGVCARLANQYGNVWLNISWDGARWLARNPQLALQAPIDRCFWGSDLSPRLIEHGYKSASISEIENWKDQLMSYLNSNKSLYNLFKNKR